MWKLNAIRFAAFAMIALSGAAIQSATRPTVAEPSVAATERPDCDKCETSMQSLEQKSRYTASGQYIGDDAPRQPGSMAAVKAKPHKVKVHHAKRHHVRHPVHRHVKHHAKPTKAKASASLHVHHADHRPRAGLHAGQASPRLVAGRPVTSKSMTLAEKKERCTPDVIRLCAAEIPNRDKIVSCLKANRAQLSKACAPVFADATPFHMRS
jgi:hypothetical protein